ncbi:unnamed protein product [Owenia fusiformis]|uniref:Uncharacterized protein n=1 Tax=Owenia fusiformis TaxID=6347 RepID=A0A8J1UUY3_OWEFU|nr:unnamed protein product [Owenia fusiformis]
MALALETTMAVITLMTLLSAQVNSAPVVGTAPTWQNPCGDGSSIGDATPAVWASVTSGDGTHSTHYKEVSDSAIRAKRSIEDIQNLLVLKGRITTSKIEQIKTLKLSHMPTSEALSKAKETAHNEDSLRRARKELAEVSVFLKHMIEEEEDVFIGQTSASLLNEMKEFEQKYFYGGVFCNVHHTMIATGVNHDFNFNHEGRIRDSIIDLLGNEAQRNVAYYIILRDMGNLFDFQKLEFLELAKKNAS